MPDELILIIEDDAHIGGLVVQVLNEAGYCAALVADVEAASQWRDGGGRPHAVISDLMVTGAASPAQLAEHLRGMFPGVPLTLMTGVPPKRRAHLGVTHDRILEKPFELEDLLASVRSMLATKASAPIPKAGAA